MIGNKTRTENVQDPLLIKWEQNKKEKKEKGLNWVGGTVRGLWENVLLTPPSILTKEK